MDKELVNHMKLIKVVSLVFVLIAVVLTFSYQQLISAVLLPQYIDWARDMDNRGLESGIALNPTELVLASEIGIQHPERIRLVYVDEVPFPYENLALKTLGEALGFIGEGIVNNAQVFGYSIYVRKGYDLNRPKLAHELVHVLQIERSSLDKVITQHFSDLAAYGYEKSPLEVEAFEANKSY